MEIALKSFFHEEVYDTVIVAIGRYADTAQLGLENLDIKVAEKNSKIPIGYD